MQESTKYKITVQVADVEPFSFVIDQSEEPIFRKAAYHLNKLWKEMEAKQPGKSSHYALAKAALAFAELYYRKSEQLAVQATMLDKFEGELDKILMGME